MGHPAQVQNQAVRDLAGQIKPEEIDGWIARNTEATVTANRWWQIVMCTLSSRIIWVADHLSIRHQGQIEFADSFVAESPVVTDIEHVLQTECPANE